MLCQLHNPRLILDRVFRDNPPPQSTIFKTTILNRNTDLGVVTAGWPKLSDAVPTAYDTAMIRADRAVAEEIRRELDPEIPMFDISGSTTLEKAAWSREIDAFVAVSSSGTIFTTGIGGTPGVLMTCRALSARAQEMAASNAEFANVSNVCVVDEEHIRDENPKAGVNSDFDLDWRHLCEPLRRILEARVQATSAN